MTNTPHRNTDRPSPDEVSSTETVRYYRARSTGLNNGSTWVIGPVLAEVHVRTFASHYRATSWVVVDGRHQFGQPADFLGADGTPSSSPLTDWRELDVPEPRQGTGPRTHPVPADHFEQHPVPAVRYVTRHTGELAEGDVLSVHGMRLRLGPVSTYAGGQYGPVFHARGRVLNLEQLERRAAEAPYGDEAFCLRFIRADGGTWTVQGNRLAHWAVEVPAELTWDERPGAIAAAAERLAGTLPAPFAAERLAAEVDAHGFATERYGSEQ